MRFSWRNRTGGPVIAGHRGSPRRAPENTVASFLMAVEEGADAVELDVRLSADGRLMVIHDDEVDRTSDGSGIVNRLTEEEIRGLDAGSWFSRKFKGERIPSLGDLLRICGGKIGFNIEVKTGRGGGADSALVEAVLGELNRYGGDDDILVSSFDADFLKLFREREPKTATGLLYDPLDKPFSDPVAGSARLRADYLIVSRLGAGIRLAEAARKAGLMLGIFTINTQAQAEMALRSGADLIISDYPGKIRKFVEKKSPHQGG